MAKKQDKIAKEGILEVTDSTEKETVQPESTEDVKETSTEEAVEKSAEEVNVETPESTEEVKVVKPTVEEPTVETTHVVETEKTPEVTAEVTTETKPSEFKESSKVTFKAPKVRLFEKSHSAKCAKATNGGQYFVWDSEVINNRVRVTECADGVGEISKIAGWIEVSDIETK
jgi:hypothetical protein